MKIFDMSEGATPLTNDDLDGLIPSHYTSRSQLDAHEQANIIQARHWAFKSRKLKKDLISYSGLMLLHKKMFEDTWEWAGKLRTVQTNIGIEAIQISSELGKLTGDVSFWLKNDTYSLVELAVRFHHRLVWIHPFPNGNGRHARLAADLFVEFNGGAELTWGRANLSFDSENRKKYIDSLRCADNYDFKKLIDFATS